MGRYTKGQFDAEEAELTASIEQKKNLKPRIKKIENMNLPYHEIVMKDGTICDLVNIFIFNLSKSNETFHHM